MLLLAVMVSTCAVLCFALTKEILFSGTALSVAVLLYLALIHRESRLKRLFPKEVMVALLFAAGSTISVWSDVHRARQALPAILAFASLCMLNCSAVDTWEWKSVVERRHAPHRVVRIIGNHFRLFCSIFVASAFLLLQRNAELTIALGGSAALLLLLSQIRSRFSAETLRLLADVCLLLVPFTYILSRHLEL
jgi:hypothetical protein